MRVQIIKTYRYAEDRVHVKTAEPPAIIDLPDHLAKSCVKSRKGILLTDEQPAEVETKVDPPVETQEAAPVEVQEDAPVETPEEEEVETKAEPDILIEDLTELTAIGDANEKALNQVGIYNYHDFMHFLSTEEGREFCVALPKFQPKHVQVVHDELLAKLQA